MKIRIIPRLEIKGETLVKGIQLDGLRVLGLPQDFAKLYYQENADEIIYIDVVASLYERSISPEVVQKTSKDLFIPLTVGGGIKSINDIEVLLNSGADKVAINTAAIKNPNLISEASKIFGSQCIVLSVEAKKTSWGYEAYTESGRQQTGLNIENWIKRGIELGAGEVLLTSIDREGTGMGFDLELIQLLEKIVTVPFLIAGGAGNIEDVLRLLKCSKPDGICVSSLFHYHYIDKILNSSQESKNVVEYYKPQNANFELTKKRVDFKPVSVVDLKNIVNNFVQNVSLS